MADNKKKKKKVDKLAWGDGDVEFMPAVPGSPAAKAGNPMAKKKTTSAAKKK